MLGTLERDFGTSHEPVALMRSGREPVVVLTHERIELRTRIVAAAVLTITAACEGSKQADVGESVRVVAIPAAENADRQFLVQMLDHHAGLTLVTHAAIEWTGDAAGLEDARFIDLRPDVERDRLAGILRREFGASYAPTVLQVHQVMVAHRREAGHMIDEFMPRLHDQEVRSLAGEIRANQIREIAELEAELGAS